MVECGLWVHECVVNPKEQVKGLKWVIEHSTIPSIGQGRGATIPNKPPITGDVILIV